MVADQPKGMATVGRAACDPVASQRTAITASKRVDGCLAAASAPAYAASRVTASSTSAARTTAGKRAPPSRGTRTDTWDSPGLVDRLGDLLAQPPRAPGVELDRRHREAVAAEA